VAGMSDTSPDVERVLTEVFRQMTPARKWHLLGRAYDQARALHAAGLRREAPGITAREITVDWARRALGIDIPPPARDPARRPDMANLHDFIEVAAVFDRLGLAYALGGSMASSIHGVIRHTNDADVVALPFPGRERELIEALGPDYYASEAAIRQAIARRSSFNLINTATGFKVDVFISSEDEFEQSVMARREALEFEEPTRQTIYVQTAEDTLLSKLRWYRLGNEVSEQQWKDVLGLVKTKRDRLDQAYLKHWSERLLVADLLARAFAEGALLE
jgi:hypothetical protein